MTRPARLAAALVAAAALAWSCEPDRRPAAREREPAATPAPARLSAADGEALLAARAAAAERVPEPAAPAPAPAAAAASPRALTVRARLLDRAWRAIPGARLAWIDSPERSATHAVPHLVVRAETRADASGAAWLAVERGEDEHGEPLTVVARAAGHLRLWRTLDPRGAVGGVLDLGEWVLGPGGDVAGRVVDARGAPVAGAVVQLVPELGEDSAEREQARLWPLAGELDVPELLPLDFTGADGRFVLAGMPPGRFDVVAWTLARDPPALPARAAGLVVHPGATADAGVLALELADPAETITGRVLGPDGAPVAGALVQLATDGATLPARTRSGEDGRFALPAPRDAELRVHASDPERRWAGASTAARAGGPPVELRFPPPATADDPGGE